MMKKQNTEIQNEVTLSSGTADIGLATLAVAANRSSEDDGKR